MTIAPGAVLGTVLGVWAYPDDEAYLSSGLMAQAGAAGSRVVFVTATRGEGGSLDRERWPPDELGEVRAAELQRCLSMVGVQEHIFLDLGDVDWHTPLRNEDADAVDAVMARVATNTMLTFGPDGITNHEGHKSVSRWTTEAFRRYAPAGAGLDYAVHSREWGEEFLPHLESLGAFRDGAEPPIVDDDQMHLDLRMDGDLLELKSGGDHGAPESDSWIGRCIWCRSLEPSHGP
ncbi:MAG: PIG-L family deacetylase [Actinomycetia bacterium]|nr:PIG-L family deacetylase [Actinomycetes bacterium]